MASPKLSAVCFARLLLASTLVAGGLASAAPAQPPDESAPAQPQPVLVELFTSEGCSDCPPADALLARLDQTQFVPGVHAIVLSEHVTYWNHEGWRDPFSFEAMTDRQDQYVQRFGLQSPYTPQMVVDGFEQFVGNDPNAMVRAVARAAEAPKQKIVIGNVTWASGDVHFSVTGSALSNATLFAALAENATHSEVSRGENKGRTLHHVAVVRVLKDFGSKDADGRPLQLSAGDKTAGPLRLVVFLTDRKSGHVVAVAEKTQAP